MTAMDIAMWISGLPFVFELDKTHRVDVTDDLQE
jgi:hypothetical protein